MTPGIRYYTVGHIVPENHTRNLSARNSLAFLLILILGGCHGHVNEREKIIQPASQISTDDEDARSALFKHPLRAYFMGLDCIWLNLGCGERCPSATTTSSDNYSAFEGCPYHQ